MPVADNATSFPTFTIQINDVRMPLLRLTHLSSHCSSLSFTDISYLGILQTSQPLQPDLSRSGHTLKRAIDRGRGCRDLPRTVVIFIKTASSATPLFHSCRPERDLGFGYMLRSLHRRIVFFRSYSLCTRECASRWLICD